MSEAAQAPQEGQPPKPETFDAEYVAKLRQEAAKYRTEAKANAEAAQRLAEYEKGAKSEADRIADLERRLADADAREQRSRLVQTVAAKYKVADPEDISLFLTGQDEDTLTAQAKRLAARDEGRRKAGDIVPDAGRTPTTTQGDTAEREFARQLFSKE